MRFSSKVARLVLLSVLMLVVGCANEMPQRNRSGSGGGEDPAQSLAGCPDQDAGGEVEFAPPVGFLARAERWVEVLGRSPEFDDPAVLEKNSFMRLDLEVAAVTDIDHNGEPHVENLMLHTSTFSGLAWAFDNRARVFVAYQSTGLPRELPLYVIGRPAGADPFFIGECQYAALTTPIRNLVGQAAPSTIDALVGLTSEKQIRALFGEDSEPTSPQPTALNPENASGAILDKLTRASFVLEYPKTWVGPYVICTKITEGWNDGLTLQSMADGPRLLDAYVASDSLIEIWLLDQDATLATPVERVAVLDLAKWVDLIDHKGGAVFEVRLDGQFDPTSERPISGASAEVTGVALWDDVLLDPELQASVLG
jgi:hypothetical protein